MPEPTSESKPAVRRKPLNGASIPLTDATGFVKEKRFARDAEYLRADSVTHESDKGEDRGLPYHVFLPADKRYGPEESFSMIRWGGRVIVASEDMAELRQSAARYVKHEGFVIDLPPTELKKTFFGLPIFGKKYHYFIARRVHLLRPGESTDRFTYSVQLASRRNGHDVEYVVVKQVPTVDRVMSRLRQKFPDTPMDELRRRALKFTEKIFPVFLSREAAMLKILQRDLPKPYSDRVPRCLGVEHDSKGFVRTLYMNWLRNGGRMLSQLEFATQATELLQVLHDKVGVIHLDLRLDNFVITSEGVGFIDFGSAVRVGESFGDNTLLSTLFEEMMRTSQIQRMLYTMSEKGLVTSDVLCQGVHKVDKAVDLFYLAYQMNTPHQNPDFVGLISYDPRSAEARHIKYLTSEILRPEDRANSPYKTASDILRGLAKVKRDIETGAEALQPSPAKSRRMADESAGTLRPSAVPVSKRSVAAR